jgi:hypothetical protein
MSTLFMHCFPMAPPANQPLVCGVNMESTYRANATIEVVVRATTRRGEHGHCGTASRDRDLLLDAIARFMSGERKREAEGLNVTGPRAGVTWPRAEKPSDTARTWPADESHPSTSVHLEDDLRFPLRSIMRRDIARLSTAKVPVSTPSWPHRSHRR